MKNINLSELTAFVTVAEHLNFRSAADFLGMSPSALSHSIKNMEASLGCRLFNRTTRSVSLTPAGMDLLKQVNPALNLLKGALNGVASESGNLSGLIRINAGEGPIRRLLVGFLPGFLAQHPGIDFEFVDDSQYVDIVADGFDAGIRLFDEVPRDMVAIKISPEWKMIAVASPAYFEKNGQPQHPKDLLQHRCIRIRFTSKALFKWNLERGNESVEIDVKGPLTMGNPKLMVDAAVAGHGIAWVPDMLAQAQLQAGRLLQVLADWSPSMAALALYYPPNRHQSAVFNQFTQALREWEMRLNPDF